eukprot:TRINITY_DN17_c3_g2_i1.p1 TRINITY_DN17_c3_g2~~TRINITY_DN17_c3_g2_i1.p1  ORF type:complete len:756 (-),score=159.39 TRINITY_DN17_c3_g2_i1:70-2265(-)
MALEKWSEEKKPSFLMNVGDNFYMWGADSTHSPNWELMYENLYTHPSLQIPWLSGLGNHDYGGHECDACLFEAKQASGWWQNDGEEDPRRDRPCSKAMIDYDTEHDWQWPNRKAVRWVMPMKDKDRWYMKSFKFPKANVTVDMFVIDTNKANAANQCGQTCPKSQKGECYRFFADLWRRQTDWLLKALEKSAATWKIVMGHHPPENFEPSLMDAMADRGVSAYLCGHVHQLRHDQHPSGIATIVVGSSGGYQSAGGGTAFTLHQSGWYGFASVQLLPDKLIVRYVDDTGRVLWDPVTVKRGNPDKHFLDRLRKAAKDYDAKAMADAVQDCKAAGVDNGLIDSAALEEVQALASGGAATAKFRFQAERKTLFLPAELSPWTTAQQLPQGDLSLAYDKENRDGCSANTSSDVVFQGKVAFFYGSRSCDNAVRESHARAGGAIGVVVAEWRGEKDAKSLEMQTVRQLQGDEPVKSQIPLLTVDSKPCQHFVSWFLNPAQHPQISLLGSEIALQHAVEAAEAAGISKEAIDKSVKHGQQLKALAQLVEARNSEDEDAVRQALKLAAEVNFRNSDVESAEMWLARLDTERKLKGKLPDDFVEINELVQTAKSLGIANDIEEPAIQKRRDLAVQALKDALEKGADCNKHMELARAHAEIAGVSEQEIGDSQSQCDQIVSKMDDSAWVVALLVLMAALIVAAFAAYRYYGRAKQARDQPSRTEGEPSRGIELQEETAD